MTFAVARDVALRFRPQYFLCSLLSLTSAGHYYGPPAPLNPDGTVADTPEVAATKLAHYAELSKAGGAVPVYHNAYWNYGSNGGYHAPVWYGAAPLNPDGTVAETPEVQHAKAVHFAAYHAALSRGKRWAPLNPDGTVADTPEVAAAKAAHFAEVAKARGIIGYAPLGLYPRRWWGPSAPLNPDGTVAETAEVRAAKAVHFAAHAGARLGVRPVPLPGFSLYSYSHPHVPAPLNADGTVAETPEVLARKAEHFAAHGQALARIAHYG